MGISNPRIRFIRASARSVVGRTICFSGAVRSRRTWTTQKRPTCFVAYEPKPVTRRIPRGDRRFNEPLGNTVTTWNRNPFGDLEVDPSLRPAKGDRNGKSEETYLRNAVWVLPVTALVLLVALFAIQRAETTVLVAKGL